MEIGDKTIFQGWYPKAVCLKSTGGFAVFKDATADTHPYAIGPHAAQAWANAVTKHLEDEQENPRPRRTK